VSASPSLPRLLYVAIGASETVGVGTDEPLREAWPQVFFRTGLPPSTAFVNLGIPGATVATALERELPEALALRPDLVTVWLNVNDLIAGVPASRYEMELDELVSGLRGGRVGTVLVANTPPLDRLPVYLACAPNVPLPEGGCDPVRELSLQQIEDAVSGYNDAVDRVARRHGAIVVDLHSVTVRERAAGREPDLYADDGFHPSTLGHRLVARAFADAFDQVGLG
jgi:acyl-CoA thioesterase-1